MTVISPLVDVFKKIKISGRRLFARWRFILQIRLGQKTELAPIQTRIITLDSDRLNYEQFQRYAPRTTYVQNVLVPQLGQMRLSPEILTGITPADLRRNENEIFLGGQKFQWGRDREGELAAPYQVCLVLGHMKIWEEAVRRGHWVLVLEDDAFLEKKDMMLIVRTLWEYQFLPSQVSSDSILYLQSTCPWRPGKSLKNYPSSSLIKVDRRFCEVSPSWQDISGTAAYFVSPQTCRMLLDHFSASPLWNIDGMFDDLKRSGVIKIHIPRKYRRNFKLHPNFA